MNKFPNSGLHARYDVEVWRSDGAVKNRKAIEPAGGDDAPGQKPQEGQNPGRIVHKRHYRFSAASFERKVSWVLTTALWFM